MERSSSGFKGNAPSDAVRKELRPIHGDAGKGVLHGSLGSARPCSKPKSPAGAAADWAPAPGARRVLRRAPSRRTGKSVNTSPFTTRKAPAAEQRQRAEYAARRLQRPRRLLAVDDPHAVARAVAQTSRIIAAEPGEIDHDCARCRRAPAARRDARSTACRAPASSGFGIAVGQRPHALAASGRQDHGDARSSVAGASVARRSFAQGTALARACAAVETLVRCARRCSRANSAVSG